MKPDRWGCRVNRKRISAPDVLGGRRVQAAEQGTWALGEKMGKSFWREGRSTLTRERELGCWVGILCEAGDYQCKMKPVGRVRVFLQHDGLFAACTRKHLIKYVRFFQGLVLTRQLVGRES